MKMDNNQLFFGEANVFFAWHCINAEFGFKLFSPFFFTVFSITSLLGDFFMVRL